MNINLLKAEIVKNGYNHKIVAQKMGISEATFCRKIKNAKFGTDEAAKLIDILNIENPCRIFFED